MPEPELTRAVVDHDEVVPLGRPEIVDASKPVGRSQHAEVAGTIQHGEEEHPPRGIGDHLHLVALSPF